MPFQVSPPLSSRQTSKKAAAAVTGGPITLFTIAGGRVRILDLVAVVVTVIGGGATSIKLVANPSGAGANTDMCAASAITSAAVDSLFAITGLVADALVVISATQGAIRGMTTPLDLNPGTIEETVTAGGTTGAVDWYVTWEPIDFGATLS